MEEILKNEDIERICTTINEPLFIKRGEKWYKNLYLGINSGGKQKICFYSGFGNWKDSKLRIPRGDEIKTSDKINLNRIKNTLGIKTYKDLYQKVNDAIILEYKDKITNITNENLKENLDKTTAK